MWSTTEELGIPWEGEEFEAPPVRWSDVLFRAVHGGERRINTLIAIGRKAGGPDDKTVRTAVMKLLAVPYPKAAQSGGVTCERDVRRYSPKTPDVPKVIFT